MSKPRYWWWSAVRLAIRQYPSLQARKAELQSMQITRAVKSYKGKDGRLHDYYGIPGGGGDGRTVERLATAELPPAEEAILEAVQSALEQTEAGRAGEEHLRLIEDYYWRRLPLHTAADRAYIDYKTAQRWNGAFARRVARELGYLPKRGEAQ